MKSNSCRHLHPAKNAALCPVAHSGCEPGMLAAPPASCVRILLGLDVPAGLLPEITEDWALVATLLQEAPEQASAAIATALGRLQRHVVEVAGAAVLKHENPFAVWLRAGSDAGAAPGPSPHLEESRMSADRG